MVILKINTISKLENSFDRIISELKKRSIEIIQTETKREKKGV